MVPAAGDRRRDRLILLRRALIVLGLLAAAWASALAAGFSLVFRFHGVLVSSHRSTTPVAISVVAFTSVWALSRRIGPMAAWRLEAAWWFLQVRRLSPPVVLLLIVIGLRVYQWWRAPPLWLDEETIALNVRERSFAALAGPLWFDQSAPLGWLALERVAVLAGGTSERMLRLPPLIFGCATLGAAVWMGRRWLGGLAGLTLVWLCAISRWPTHYWSETKHYTADTFFALMLPALAVRAIEGADAEERFRRVMWWWIAAAAGAWLSNGAALVAPAGAVFLVLAVRRRSGWRAAVATAAPGVIFLAAFGAHYALSVRYTLANSFLRDFWSSGYPPSAAGLSGTIVWLAHQLGPLARNPASTTWPVVLWGCAIGGFLFGRPPMLAAAFGLIPVSGFLFGALRLVPLRERLSLWIVPALYVGVAMWVGLTVDASRAAIRRRRWVAAGVAGLAASAAVGLCAEMFANNRVHLGLAPTDKQNLEDRESVRWLSSKRAPGDVVLATRLTWPAIWWYDGTPVRYPRVAAGRLPDGTLMYEVGHEDDELSCREDRLGALLRAHPRALVYLGFRDMPEGFDDLLLAELNARGTITEYREFSYLSRAAVVEARTSGRQGPAGTPTPIRGRSRKPLAGCVAVRPAHRW